MRYPLMRYVTLRLREIPGVCVRARAAGDLSGDPHRHDGLQPVYAAEERGTLQAAV